MRNILFRLIGILAIAGGMYGVAAMLHRLIATPIFSYALHCGAYVNVFATLQSMPRLGIDWYFGSQGFVLAAAGPGLSRLGINLLALLSWLALRLR